MITRFLRFMATQRPAPAPPPASRPQQPAGEEDATLTDLAREMLRNQDAGELADTVHVYWNSRLQTTAGTASRRENRIDLNPLLRDLGPEPVLRTLKHEAAHLLAHYRAGRRRIQVHGAEWHQACADLGIPDEKACHELPLPRRQISRKLAYQCPHCQIIVQRVRPFRPNTACYHCCRKYNSGRYSKLYQFTRVEPPATSPGRPPESSGKS